MPRRVLGERRLSAIAEIAYERGSFHVVRKCLSCPGARAGGGYAAWAAAACARTRARRERRADCDGALSTDVGCFSRALSVCVCVDGRLVTRCERNVSQ